MAVRFKLTSRFNGHGCGPRRIQVFLNEVRIQSQRTLGEQGVVDGSLLTVRWLWSEEQRKKTNCLTREERADEMEKQTRNIQNKRKAFLMEKGTTEDELASIGFHLSNPRPWRSRSPSEGQSDPDGYIVYHSVTGERISAHSYAKDVPEESRILNIGDNAAAILGVRPDQIKMHKELDVKSGECKVVVTAVPLDYT